MIVRVSADRSWRVGGGMGMLGREYSYVCVCEELLTSVDTRSVEVQGAWTNELSSFVHGKVHPSTQLAVWTGRAYPSLPPAVWT